jgi:hypothetical protein
VDTGKDDVLHKEAFLSDDSDSPETEEEFEAYVQKFKESNSPKGDRPYCPSRQPGRHYHVSKTFVTAAYCWRIRV